MTPTEILLKLIKVCPEVKESTLPLCYRRSLDFKLNRRKVYYVIEENMSIKVVTGKTNKEALTILFGFEPMLINKEYIWRFSNDTNI
jgi:hypothetical protein